MATPLQILKAATKLHKAGRHKEAERLYRGVLKNDAGNADAWHLLGLIKHHEGRQKLAADHVSRAIKLHPDSAKMHSSLGTIYRSSGRYQDSIECFNHALEIDPNDTSIYCHMGHSYRCLGETDKAKQYYQRALKIDPDYANAYKGLGEMTREGVYQYSHNDLERMKKLINQPDYSLAHKKLLHFTLADHFHIKGDHKQAFHYYKLANDTNKTIAQQTNNAFKVANYESSIDRIMMAFDEDYFQRKQRTGLESEVPVFIVGMPRSGTTLTESILASHPQVHGAGELQYIGQISADLPAQLVSFGGYPECVSGLDPSNTNWHAREYLQRLEDSAGAGDASHSRIVDKMPENYYHLGLIATLFPNARIIHCTRDPMDTCLSCYCQNFKIKYASDLKHLGLVYRQYQRLMQHWHNVLPLPIMDIAYEDLVAKPETKMRELIDFIGLPWDPNCVKPHENVGAIRTASNLQVRKKIYTSSVKRWKRYEAYLKPLSDELSKRL